ncbi:hypothetical protein AB0E27_37655 [Streptomyces sparsogenes]|uniref:hypothetical protein n=1 Tax=Streptomyces sparsogenes TaxID=67365 RepID=UPI0033EA7AB7
MKTPATADRNGGYSAPSRQALATYTQQAQRLTADRGLTSTDTAGIDESPLGGLGARYTSFPTLIDAAVAAALPDAQEEQR